MYITYLLLSVLHLAGYLEILSFKCRTHKWQRNPEKYVAPADKSLFEDNPLRYPVKVRD
jgi:hypothetical protein